MKTYVLQALRLTLTCGLFFCLVYTLLVWILAQLVPGKGLGEVLLCSGKTYYGAIGQRFTDKAYFWSRPSAASYNAAGAGGSNKGPANPEYLEEVQARIDTILAWHPGTRVADIPADLVTASASGLDPDISVAAALLQVRRIARQRQIPEDKIRRLVRGHTQGPLLGLFGPEHINVLRLNLALDQLR